MSHVSMNQVVKQARRVMIEHHVERVHPDFDDLCTQVYDGRFVLRSSQELNRFLETAWPTETSQRN